MKKFIAMVLTLAFAALAGSAYAGSTWKKFNANPAYQSQKAAIADAPRVFREVGYPEPVIKLLVEAMKDPGERTHITNGMKLDFMRSGKSEIWRNVLVDFDKPEGEDNMAFSAPAEKWTVEWKGTMYAVLVPDVCNNLNALPPQARLKQVDITATASSPPVPAVFTTSACPNGFTLIANAWSLGTLGNLRHEAEKLIQSANERDSHEAMRLEAYKPADFSRTMGGRLRSEVKNRAAISADLPIRFLDPRTAKVVRELGTIHMVRGVGSFRFAEDPRAYVIEVVFPPDFVSPAMSGGERRWRMLDYEWKNGQKDWCALNGHGALQP